MTTTITSETQPAGRHQVWSSVLNVAWIAILLGVAIETCSC